MQNWARSVGVSCGCDDPVLLCRNLQSNIKAKCSNDNASQVKGKGHWHCGWKMALHYQKIVTMNTCQPNTDGREKHKDYSQGYTKTETITSAIYTTYLLIFTGTVLCSFKVVLHNPSLDYVGSCTSNDLWTFTVGILTIFAVTLSAARKIQGHISIKQWQLHPKSLPIQCPLLISSMINTCSIIQPNIIRNLISLSNSQMPLTFGLEVKWED